MTINRIEREKIYESSFSKRAKRTVFFPSTASADLFCTGINRDALCSAEPCGPDAARWRLSAARRRSGMDGLEISGIVCKIGDVAKKNSGLAVGDRVCALLGGGGYAEYAAVDYPMVMKVPDCLSLAQASTIPEGYATAYLNLFTEGKLQKNETVLVHAGASGVGIAVQQIVKAYGLRSL